MNIFKKIWRWLFGKKPRKHEYNDFKVLQLVVKDQPAFEPELIYEPPIEKIIEPEPVRQKFHTTPNPNKYWRRFKRGHKVYWKKFYKTPAI